MENNEITMTLEMLEGLLRQQKELTVKQCLSHSYVYNNESTNGHLKPLPINEDKFKEHGMKARYPDDFEVLKRYIK